MKSINFNFRILISKLILLICIGIILSGCKSTLATIYQENWEQNFQSIRYSVAHRCAVPASLDPANFRHVVYGRPGVFICVCDHGHPVCGYNCAVNQDGNAKCAEFPGQFCLVGTQGHIACGFDCKQTVYEARCAVRYGDTCVINKYEHIVCGLNCRVDDGLVRCERSPSYWPQY